MSRLFAIAFVVSSIWIVLCFDAATLLKGDPGQTPLRGVAVAASRFAERARRAPARPNCDAELPRSGMAVVDEIGASA